MSRGIRHLGVALAAVLIAAGRLMAQGAGGDTSQKLYVAEPVTLRPGFAVGDIAVGDPTIADFRVLKGRREILVFGKTPGRTTLTVWDQPGTRRSEIALYVTTREGEQIEHDLAAFLKDFPSVRVTKLGDAVVVAGDVHSESELDAVQRIADAAGVRSVVRYVPAAHGAEEPAPRTGASAGSIDPGHDEPGATIGTRAVEYEIRIVEASVAFGSGTYGTGVEPSGPVLASQRVQSPFGASRQIAFMDPVLVRKVGKNKGSDAKGIRVRVSPAATDDPAAIATTIELETNLPFESKTYHPELWRHARWQVSTTSGEPIAIAGADLLAVLSEDRSPGSAIRTLQSAVGFANSVVTAVPTVATAYTYDPVKKTQLLMLIRAWVVPQAR